MRLRKVKGAEEGILESPWCIPASEALAGHWADRLPLPLSLEVGMGKGRFVTEMARLHSDRGFVGIEVQKSVLYRAVQKMENGEAPPANLRFLCADAGGLSAYFAPGEVGAIYLNFPDPWPKRRHEKRRLTSRGFLTLYASLLPPGGVLRLKTDDDALFAFSQKEAEEHPSFTVTAAAFDLHGDPLLSQDNVLTEYEERFLSRGQKIHLLALTRIPGAWNSTS